MRKTEGYKTKKRMGARDRYDGLSRDEWKAKKRKMRRRTVRIQKIVLAVLVIGVIGGGGFAILWNLPEIRLDRQLRAGDTYTQEAACNEAIAAYEKALEIDVTSVKAYRCMAEAYLDMAEEAQAKQVLVDGWERTQDENLLQYYCTLILNEAVAEINADEVELKTADKIVSVTKTWTGEGMTTEMIGDWGGAYQWEKTY